MKKTSRKILAVDERGCCYAIDADLIKKHGKKLSKRLPVTGPTSCDVKGQDWFVCSWSAHVNCGS